MNCRLLPAVAALALAACGPKIEGDFWEAPGDGYWRIAKQNGELLARRYSDSWDEHPIAMRLKQDGKSFVGDLPGLLGSTPLSLTPTEVGLSVLVSGHQQDLKRIDLSRGQSTFSNDRAVERVRAQLEKTLAVLTQHPDCDLFRSAFSMMGSPGPGKKRNAAHLIEAFAKPEVTVAAVRKKAGALRDRYSASGEIAVGEISTTHSDQKACAKSEKGLFGEPECVAWKKATIVLKTTPARIPFAFNADVARFPELGSDVHVTWTAFADRTGSAGPSLFGGPLAGPDAQALCALIGTKAQGASMVVAESTR